MFYIVPEGASLIEGKLTVGRGERKGDWKEIFVGDGYPVDPAEPATKDYMLHILDSGAPRWVKEVTLRSYENSQHKRRRMAEKCGGRV